MTATLGESHARILADDLARIMPGCDITAAPNGRGGIDAEARHRVTGLSLSLTVGAGPYTLATEWRLVNGTAVTLGISAYGFDAAVSHAYRHRLDYTAEHGPWSAWHYEESAR